LLFNGHDEQIEWTLLKQWGKWWDLIVDTWCAGTRRADEKGFGCWRRDAYSDHMTGSHTFATARATGSPVAAA